MSTRGLFLVVVGLVGGLESGCSAAPACSSSNCANGCCDSAGSCQPGSSDSQCGAFGAACSPCNLGLTCRFGTCSTLSTGTGGGSGGGSTGGGGGGSIGGGGGSVGGGGGSTGGGTGGGAGTCSPANCDGCCDSRGTCVRAPNNANNTTCGSAGNGCLDCAASAATCNPNTFSCSSTNTGGGTGGGGGVVTCDGCVLPSGTCVPLSRTSVINCGALGDRCVACASGQLCTNGMCTTPAALKRVGSACANDGECIGGLGSSAICKLTTTSGNASYTGGYCTLRCPASACPTGSNCVAAQNPYGEGEALCWDSCGTSDPCRSPGYACYSLGTGSACWLSPLPTVDAGVPADKVGNACTSTNDCINPPTSRGACLSSEFMMTWPGGYCSRLDCLTNAECAVDGGAICIGFDANQTACVRKCADSSAGQSNCRSGYTCTPYITRLPDGGMQSSTDGFCSP